MKNILFCIVIGIVFWGCHDEQILTTIPPPAPPVPSFAYNSHWLESRTPSYPNDPFTHGYYLKVDNTTIDTVGVVFSWAIDSGFWMPIPQKFFIPSIGYDTVIVTVTLTATRNGISNTQSKVFVLETSPPPPSFDLTKVILHSVPLTRPNGSAWNPNDASPVDSILLMSAYHVVGYFNASDLPFRLFFNRNIFNGGSTPVSDPTPEKYHILSVKRLQPDGISLETMDTLGFFPNNCRFAGSDSGKVELQNANTHITAWLKFYD